MIIVFVPFAGSGWRGLGLGVAGAIATIVGGVAGRGAGVAAGRRTVGGVR